MLNPRIWQPINNNPTGYIGKRRNEEWVKRDAKYGKGNWKIASVFWYNLNSYV